MRSYIQKPKTNSRVIEAKMRPSRQAGIKEILQTYNPNPVQKRDVIPMPVREQGQCGVLQREIDPDVLASLAIPLFQVDNTTTCWFLSILYGIHQAGWVRDLFDKNVIVTKTGLNQYRCAEGDRTVDVVYVEDGRPLWQQILEGFINNDITIKAISSTYFKAPGLPEFNKLRSVGVGAGLPRASLKDAVQSLLGGIYKGWEVQDAQSMSPTVAVGDDKTLKGSVTKNPFKQMVGKPYLIPFQEANKEILEVMTVEKNAHAMAVKAATLDGEALPNVQQPSEAKKNPAFKKVGVKISNLEVFNQSFVEPNAQNATNVRVEFKEKNTQKFKDIKPGISGNVFASGQSGIPDWADTKKPKNQLGYINYYKLARAKIPQVVSQPVLVDKQKLEEVIKQIVEPKVAIALEIKQVIEQAKERVREQTRNGGQPEEVVKVEEVDKELAELEEQLQQLKKD